MRKHIAKYLLPLAACLCLQLHAALSPADGVGPVRQQACSDAVVKRVEQSEGAIRAAETSPVTYMFRITNSLRSVVRIPARTSNPQFSFEKVTILYSVHKTPLNRIFIRNNARATSMSPVPSRRYYVFALREIVI